MCVKIKNKSKKVNFSWEKENIWEMSYWKEDPEKTNTMVSQLVPRNKKKVRNFVELCS